MHIILGLIGLATAAYFLVMRARRGAEMATELLDVADDIRAAARRFGFNRRYNQHAVDSIDDPRVAIGGLTSAFLSLDDLPTKDARAAMNVSLRKHLNMSGEEAQEIEVLGQWLVSECGTPVQAVPRLAKKLRSLDGDGSALQTLLAIFQGAAQSDTLSQRQTEALSEIKQAYRLR